VATPRNRGRLRPARRTANTESRLPAAAPSHHQAYPYFTRHGFEPLAGSPVEPDVYAQLLRSYDEGVAEFLDLDRVKPNTLGNTRMLLCM